MTAWKPHSFSGLSATCILLLVLSAESSAVARGGFPHDEPWSSGRIDRLPPEIRNAVLRMCRVRPTAAQYFATYVDNSRIVKLHFEDFNCEEPRMHREVDRCLREEFVRSDSHYRLTRTYYDRYGD